MTSNMNLLTAKLEIKSQIYQEKIDKLAGYKDYKEAARLTERLNEVENILLMIREIED